MTAAEEFVDLYNKIDNWLGKAGKYDRYVSYSRKIKNLQKKDSRIRLYKDDLLSYGELRNAIVHNSLKQDEIIAEPHQRVVDRYRFIYKELSEPETVYPKYGEMIIKVQPGDFINALVQQFSKSGFAQIPVFDGPDLVEIINSQTMSRWVAAKMESYGKLNQSAVKVADILPYVKYPKNFSFISADQSIYDAYDKFTAHQIAHKRHLDGLFITKNKSENSKIVGLITLDEIVGALPLESLAI